MKALVYHGPGTLSWDSHPDPSLENDSDIIVKIDAATVCGTDAHVSHGVHPEVPMGTVLGHEGVGTIVAAGSGVTRFATGDRIVIPPITSCGTCAACSAGFAAQCQTLYDNGWLLGHAIDGLQAEYARVPMADYSVYNAPAGVSNAEAILTVDVFASAYEMGIQNAEVSAGDTVVVIGDGPIGLSVAMLARLKNPATVILAGIHPFRREIALKYGVDHVVDSSKVGWVEEVRALCPNGAADAVIEAVGLKETLEAAFSLTATFGRIANIGVHTGPVSFPIEEMWIKAFTFRSGMLSCTSTPMLLELLNTGKIDGNPLISHTLDLSSAPEAYTLFDNAAHTHATKVILTP